MFTKRWKKAASLIVAGVMTAGLFAGCAKQEEEIDLSNVDTTKPIEIEMMLLNNTSGDGSQFIAKEVFKEKFNIDVKFTLNNNEAHMQKLNLLIASNELPDIVAPMPAERGKLVGPKGLLVAVDEYLDQLPNVKKYFDADKTAQISSTAADGHIYSLPRFAPDKYDYKWAPIVRKDYFDELGLPMPTTYKELFASLKKIKEKHPDVVGIVNREKMTFINAYGVSYNTAPGMFYDKKSDSFRFGPLTEGYRELVTDFAQAWQDGILDKEFFTSSEQQWQEKFLNGTGVFTLDYPKRAYTVKEAYSKLHPEDTAFDTSLIMPLTTESYDTMRLNHAETLGLWTSWSISKNTKHLGRILQLVDFMYSDEAIDLMQWGIEGETYTKTEDGKMKYTPDLKASYNPDGTIDPMNDLGLNHNRLERIELDNAVPEVPDYILSMTERYKKEVEGYETDYKISLNFTEEQTDEMEDIKLNLNTLVSEATVGLITGTTPISEYDAFVEKVKSNGATRMEEIYAEAYAAYKQNLN